MVLVFFVLVRFSGCGWESPVKYLWLGLTSSSVVPSTGGQMGMGEQEEILCVGVFWGVCYSDMHKAKMIVVLEIPSLGRAAILGFLIKSGMPGVTSYQSAYIIG